MCAAFHLDDDSAAKKMKGAAGRTDSQEEKTTLLAMWRTAKWDMIRNVEMEFKLIVSHQT